MWKIPKQTAIPEVYTELCFEDSPKFGPNTLTLKNVPGFDKIRIHSGNTQHDTDGCIIVGYKINDQGVIIPGTTKQCLIDLKHQVRKAIGPVKIRVF